MERIQILIKPNIVVIDDEIVTLKRIRRILEKEEYQVSTFISPQRVLPHLKKNTCHLVISDVKMPTMDGMDLMIKIKSSFPDTEVILMTGYASFDDAVEAVKEGAFHYLQKPFTPDQLRNIVEMALSQYQIKNSTKLSTSIQKQSCPIIIGESIKIREVLSIIQQIAPTDCNVLISGDSGSGKELVARSIHANSKRASCPFVAFNCAAINETLIENELFGHEKGAYTGAQEKSIGLLEFANKGTLFLDEIGEMPQTMQAKLLRVLQERELLRVGGCKPIPIDVRIVSATAKNIKADIDTGLFRKDLYFRINVVNIKLPDLSERKEDIPLLAYHVLNRLNQKSSKSINAITQKAMEILCNYAFPGNVRELENIIERAVAVCKGDIIRVCDLPPDLVEFEFHSYKPPETKFMTLAEIEQDYISHLLKITGGVRSKTAEILGIDRTSLWRKIKKYGLE